MAHHIYFNAGTITNIWRTTYIYIYIYIYIYMLGL